MALWAYISLSIFSKLTFVITFVPSLYVPDVDRKFIVQIVTIYNLPQVTLCNDYSLLLILLHTISKLLLFFR